MIIESSLQVVENFLPDFYQWRNYALSLPFKKEIYQGEEYDNISSDWGKYPKHLLEEVMGFPIQSTLSLFRYSTEDTQLGVDIHSDMTVDGADFASVIYMSTPEQDAAYHSGTAFFRHKATGLHGTAPLPIMKNSGLSDAIIEQIHNDASDETKWKLEGFISMKSNRLIVYPCSVFHSKYGQSFGSDVESGRLIWVNFFKGV